MESTTKTVSQEYKHFEKMCKAICGKTVHGVMVTTAGLNGTDVERLKTGRVPTLERLSICKGDREKDASVAEQLKMKAEDIQYIIKHDIFPYYLNRLDDTMSASYFSIFISDLEIHHGVKIGRKVWKKWISGEEAVPDNTLNVLTSYFMVSKETLFDYESLKKDFKEIFAKFLEKKKKDMIHEDTFIALDDSKRAIIINDRGHYTLLSGTNREFETAVKKIQELNLRDFVDYLDSNEYEAPPPKPEPPKECRGRYKGPLKVGTSKRPEEPLDFRTVPSPLKMTIDSMTKRTQMSKDDLDEELE